jgi:ketosteroid isomerase-like protein
LHAFRAAIESGDLSTIGNLFTEDAILHSPIAYRPYQGRDIVAAIISAVANVFEGFRYEKEIGGDSAGDHALVFNATVGDLQIEGCDFVHTRADGLIDEVTVMLRPLKAVTLFAEKMGTEFAALHPR